ncbi:MAG: UDP-3-O-(3-hydroxymyristoyl)glucosamine N-acyltransferase [Chitinophagaceae bacterium]|nr:UDP-3-O-(3-hydroxymyristoyl)glucosamine N-acyltransferase [Chitinophagaceae bacterium]
MRFEKPIPVTEIASLIDAEIKGNRNGWVKGINEIHRVEEGDIVFTDHPKYYAACIHSPASAIIINAETECPPDKTLLITEQPFEAYNQLVSHFKPFRPSLQMVSETAQVGEGTVLMPNVYLGHQVRIGRHCILYPNVTILNDCIIGDHVIIQSGTVIGSDAFYYNKKTHREIFYKKMNSCGRVVVEDYVEIGANCTIDRGVSGDTVIGAGTKIDNLVHLGHDVMIGKNCLIAAQAGIAGATVLEDEVTVWGQAGISKTLRIGKGAVINAQSGVMSSLEGNKIYFGYPAEEAREKLKQLAWIKRIPEIWDKLKARNI